MAAVWQVDEEEASELRLALVEAGLVERTPRDGEPRYALHQVIAHFARARLAADPGEERAAALAHARHYSHVVGGYDDAIREERMTYGAPLEWENVAVALERLAAQSAADDEAAAILLDYARSWRNVLTPLKELAYRVLLASRQWDVCDRLPRSLRRARQSQPVAV